MILFKTVSGTSQDELNNRICSFLEELKERRQPVIGMIAGEILVGERKKSGEIPITRSVSIFYEGDYRG